MKTIGTGGDVFKGYLGERGVEKEKRFKLFEFYRFKGDGELGTIVFSGGHLPVGDHRSLIGLL